MMTDTSKLELAHALAAEFENFESVEAIAVGGSLAGGSTDEHTDIDLYIFTHTTIPLVERTSIVNSFGASQRDMNLTFWDLGDQWIDKNTGTEIDLIYWDTQWISDEINKVVVKHMASMGYTTCFWRTLKECVILFDRAGWLHELKAKCEKPYPDELLQAIVNKNHPVLRQVIPSYYHQVKKAVEREDLISLNHRVAAYLASYFDILFAMNRVLHPGEKKMLPFAQHNCQLIPKDIEIKINTLFREAGSGSPALLVTLDTLTDDLEALLLEKDLI